MNGRALKWADSVECSLLVATEGVAMGELFRPWPPMYVAVRKISLGPPLYLTDSLVGFRGVLPQKDTSKRETRKAGVNSPAHDSDV